MRTLKLGNTNIYPITYAHYVYLADGVTTVSAQLSSLTTALNNLSLQNSQRIQDIADINALVPTQATTSNKLADKDFVNSSISTNTANFIGTFISVSALKDYAGTLTNNDYAFVRNRVLPTDYSTIEVLNTVSKTNLTHFDYAYVINDTKFDLYRFNIANQTWELRIQNTTKLSADSLNTAFNRYKFNGTAWVFEYTLNNSSFTAAQWNAINSGITDGLVTKLDGIETELDKKRIYYGTCSTSNNTNEKIVTTVDGNFKLEAGAVIFVEFQYKSSTSPARLKVDNTISTQVATMAIATGTYNIWDANEVVGFVYDGTYFVCFGRKSASTSSYGITYLTTSATEDIEYTSATPASINRLAQNMLAGTSVYSTSSTYAVGDKCRRGFNIYVCNTAITTAEAWNASHWTVLPSFQDQIDDIKDNLATVATSGSYDDLSNKPTIPSISGLESASNKVTSISSSSTDTQYPSAKCVYDIVGNIISLMEDL